MDIGSKVEVRPTRSIIVSKYANDEEFGNRIVGVEEQEIPDILPGYGEVIRATIIGRQGFGKEIKKNRWDWGMLWVVTFDEDPTLKSERFFQSSEITLIESE